MRQVRQVRQVRQPAERCLIALMLMPHHLEVKPRDLV
jgi:hypothetical protein